MASLTQIICMHCTICIHIHTQQEIIKLKLLFYSRIFRFHAHRSSYLIIYSSTLTTQWQLFCTNISYVQFSSIYLSLQQYDFQRCKGFNFYRINLKWNHPLTVPGLTLLQLQVWTQLWGLVWSSWCWNR